jgi:hypothetical protein
MISCEIAQRLIAVLHFYPLPAPLQQQCRLDRLHGTRAKSTQAHSIMANPKPEVLHLQASSREDRVYHFSTIWGGRGEGAEVWKLFFSW